MNKERTIKNGLSLRFIFAFFVYAFLFIVVCVTPAMAAVSATNSSTILAAEKSIEENFPKPVVSLAVPVLGSIENFRTTQARDAVKSLSKLESKLDQATSTQPSGAASGWQILAKGFGTGTIMKTPFDYVKLFFVLIWHFFTTYVYAFYVLILLVLYKVIRLIIGFFF